MHSRPRQFQQACPTDIHDIMTGYRFAMEPTYVATYVDPKAPLLSAAVRRSTFLRIIHD
jgi:hypothetical protein